MPTIHLMRHAKSSWDDPTLADHDRPLAKRGRKAARRMAAYLERRGVHPQLILCSSAVRARQTCDALDAAGDGSSEVLIEDGLYGAGAGELLSRLQQLSESVGEVLVIGHNPGLQDLALLLTGRGDAAARARLRDRFPTGAVATLTASAPWASLAAGSARLSALVTPRELPSPEHGPRG
jgi:phosphohistidine phosphatase